MKADLFKGYSIFIIAILLCLFIACRSTKDNKKEIYGDYCLVSGQPLNLLKIKELPGEKSSDDYILICDMNNHAKKVSIKSSLANFIERIETKRTTEARIYKIVYKSSLTDKGGEFWVYKDSMLKKINFGMQLGGVSGPIIGSTSIYKNKKLISYKFQIRQMDTFNLINNIWNLDSLYFKNRSDTIVDFVEIPIRLSDYVSAVEG